MDGGQKGEASIIGKGIMEGLNMTYSSTGENRNFHDSIRKKSFLPGSHVPKTVETNFSCKNHQTKRPQNVHSMLFQSSSCRVWGWDMLIPFEICRIFQVKQILQSAAATQQRDLLFLEVQMVDGLTRLSHQIRVTYKKGWTRYIGGGWICIYIYRASTYMWVVKYVHKGIYINIYDHV